MITEEILGNGSYGFVHLGCNAETQEKCAVKVIHKTQLTNIMSTQQKNEHGILKTLDHPNIIKLLDYYEDDEIILIIEELCDSNLLMVL